MKKKKTPVSADKQQCPAAVPVPYAQAEMFLALWPMRREDFDAGGGRLAGRGQLAQAADCSLDPRRTAPVRTPWGTTVPAWEGRGRLTADLPALSRPEFTAETWACFPGGGPYPSDQVIFDCRFAGGAGWSLSLDREFYLVFRWSDAEGNHDRLVSRRPVMGVLFDGRWHHLAVVFRNARPLFADDQDFIKNKEPQRSRAALYCTPAGSGWPRPVGEKINFTRPMLPLAGGRLSVGADSAGENRFLGALAETGVAELSRSENRFFTLGLPKPPDLAVSDDFPCGSGRDPVLNPAGEIVVSGTLASHPSGSWNTFFRVDGAPGPRRFCLPSSGTAFVSEDRQRWRKIAGAQLTAGGDWKEQLHFEVDLAHLPAYISSFLPFLAPDVAAAEESFSDWEFFRAFDIARTGAGRPVRGWLVSDPAGATAGKQLFIILSGQHSPAEMAGGYLLVSMLEALRRRADTRRALAGIALLVVPIVNVDAAFAGGNTALNRNGRNLNRDWDTRQEPEVAGIADCIETLAGRGARVALGLDFHSGGTCINHPRGFEAPELERLARGLARRQAQALELLDHHLGFRAQYHRFSSVEGGNWGEQSACHANQYIVARHKAPAFTLETGQMYYFDPETQANQPVDRDLLGRLGPRLLAVCLDYHARTGGRPRRKTK